VGLLSVSLFRYPPSSKYVKSLLPSLFKREEFPLFGKGLDETHRPELLEGEGLGGIF
jgi:hypothetical protein